MAEHTTISWCDATFNPWWGCIKVSPACDHCYAERAARRFAPGTVLWGVGAERRTFGVKHWEAPFVWARTLPKRLGHRPRIFCSSMADWADKVAPFESFVQLLNTIRLTAEADWLLLTKRIGIVRDRLNAALCWVVVNARVDYHGLAEWIAEWLDGKPPANVWLGATVVTQNEANRDIPKLLAVPARVRFLSIEPMLGPIDLTVDGLICSACPRCADHPADPDTGAIEHCRHCEWTGKSDEWGIDWVICGGESGPHARPMHPEWVRSLRDQCATAGVPFHFKQWGEWRPPVDGEAYDTSMGRAQLVPSFIVAHNGTVHCFSNGESTRGGEVMLRVGTKAAGRLLDGGEHNGFPETRR